MNLQISIIGIAIIAVFYMAVTGLVILPLWYKLKDKTWRKAVIVPLAVIIAVLPWVEEVWIAYHFANYCEDAGVHVTRQVVVEGYYDDTGSGPAEPGLITNPQSIKALESSGFRYKEFKAYKQDFGQPRVYIVNHMEKNANGQWRVTILNKPQARYHLKFADPRQEVSIGWKLEKRETLIVDADQDKVISRELSFNRYPNIIEGLWIGLVGSGLTICNRPLDDHDKKTLTGFPPYYTFIPVNGQ